MFQLCMICHHIVGPLASAAGNSHTDVTARFLAFSSLAVAIASLVLTWRTWKHSGGELQAILKGHCFPENEEIRFYVEIINVGRMSATVRGVTVVRLRGRWQFTRWLSWWYRLTGQESAFGSMAWPVEEDEMPSSSERFDRRDLKSRFPVSIPPTSYVTAMTAIDDDTFEAVKWVRAIVRRGDRHIVLSKRIPVPIAERRRIDR